MVPGAKKSFPRQIPPAGTHLAVCHSVHDLGYQNTSWQGEATVKHQLVIVWEIDKVIPSGDFVGKRFVVSNKYTASMSKKASLRAVVEAWRGKAFTDDEAMKFDTDALVGQPCMLSIVHKKSGENTYANINAVMGVPEGMPKLKAENPPTHEFKWIKELQAKALPPPDSNEDHYDAPVFADGTGGVNF